MQNDINITDFTNQKNSLGSETAAPKFVKTAHLYNPRVYEFFRCAKKKWNGTLNFRTNFLLFIEFERKAESDKIWIYYPNIVQC